MKKIILTDCDGVLLDWYSAYEEYTGLRTVTNTTNLAVRYGISYKEVNETVRAFNMSLYFQQLPPFKDSVKYVRKLHEECGYTFRVITAAGDHPIQIAARNKNLRDMFGSAIEQVYCLKTNSRKDRLLTAMSNVADVWVDDHHENIEDGAHAGYQSFFMNNTNMPDKFGIDANVITVNTWKEIDKLIGVRI